MLDQAFTIGKPTPLVLVAGPRGTWTMAIVVDGVRHEFVGKRISVEGWDYKIQVNEDGAEAGGTLAAVTG